MKDVRQFKTPGALWQAVPGLFHAMVPRVGDSYSSCQSVDPARLQGMAGVLRSAWDTESGVPALPGQLLMWVPGTVGDGSPSPLLGR